jgi:hypothetical protein
LRDRAALHGFLPHAQRLDHPKRVTTHRLRVGQAALHDHFRPHSTHGDPTKDEYLELEMKLGAQDQVAPLPPPAEPAPLELPIHDVAGDELAPIIPKLDALALELGCPVEEEPMSDGSHGYYEIASGRIAIDASLSANGKVKTRCHELAHALIRRERQDGDPELDRASEELVVESVAFTCVGALGIQTDGYSVPYLASWAEQSDLSVLEQTAALIDRLASRIEDAVLEAPPGQSKENAAEVL